MREPLNEKEQKNPSETTLVGDTLYNVDLLWSYAEKIKIQEFDLSQFQENVSQDHNYWIDEGGDKLGPFQILQNWEEAQKNPAWTKHIESIKQANLNDPIWMTDNGFVLNGMHRLTKAFLENKTTIKVRVFDKIPDEAIIVEE